MRTPLALLLGLLVVLAGHALVALTRGIGAAAGVLLVIGGLLYVLLVFSRPGKEKEKKRHHVPQD